MNTPVNKLINELCEALAKEFVNDTSDSYAVEQEELEADGISFDEYFEAELECYLDNLPLSIGGEVQMMTQRKIERLKEQQS